MDLPSGTTWREDYVLDANENRNRVELRALPTDATAASTDSYTRTAGTNRLASIALPTGTRSFTYDACGNLSTEARPASVAVTAGYDGLACLTSYTRTLPFGVPRRKRRCFLSGFPRRKRRCLSPALPWPIKGNGLDQRVRRNACGARAGGQGLRPPCISRDRRLSAGPQLHMVGAYTGAEADFR